MKLSELIIFFGIISNSVNASAEWIHIAAAPNFQGFADLEDIEISGSERRVWVLQNYPKQQAKGFLSVRAQCEYDCGMNRGRVLAEYWWTEHWAKGNDITPDNTPVDQRWVYPAPGSFGDLMLKIVCAKSTER